MQRSEECCWQVACLSTSQICQEYALMLTLYQISSTGLSYMTKTNSHIDRINKGEFPYVKRCNLNALWCEWTYFLTISCSVSFVSLALKFGSKIQRLWERWVKSCMTCMVSKPNLILFRSIPSNDSIGYTIMPTRLLKQNMKRKHAHAKQYLPQVSSFFMEYEGRLTVLIYCTDSTVQYLRTMSCSGPWSDQTSHTAKRRGACEAKNDLQFPTSQGLWKSSWFTGSRKGDGGWQGRHIGNCGYCYTT